MSVKTMLDAGSLPIEELALLANRESHRPRPVYTAHKWFARRFGTAMRGLLVASTLKDGDDFWGHFHGRADMTGLTVADLFIGGGTSLYEAHRLGANVVGADIDPVAALVTDFELKAHTVPDPTAILDEVLDRVADLRALYKTRGPDGAERDSLHFMYVQTINCGECAQSFDVHPNWRIAFEAKSTWALCSGCGDLSVMPTSNKILRCACGVSTRVDSGRLERGKATCPECGHQEALIEYARRTGTKPQFRMFAIESIPERRDQRTIPIRDRSFHRPTAEDLNRLATAATRLNAVRGVLPTRDVPRENRSDSRVTSYGYTRYTDLFNDRQLLHLATLINVIGDLAEEHRLAYSIAMSNHLTSNNMLTRYTPKWRQTTPLFALRGFGHSARPVELNPWLRGIGRGTFPNALRRVAAAIAYAKAPRELTKDGFVDVPTRAANGTSLVINGDSRDLPQIPDASADLILTDPPYLDNIDYSELADFFVPWLAALGQVVDGGGPDAASLAAKNRDDDSVATFRYGLTACFAEAARMLRPGGRMVFTFQHQSAGAWDALSAAMYDNKLRVVNVFPMRGDSDVSLHRHENSSTWDAVFVLAHADDQVRERELSGAAHVDACLTLAGEWAARFNLGSADRANLERALLAAGGAGFLATPFSGSGVATRDALNTLRQRHEDAA